MSGGFAPEAATLLFGTACAVLSGIVVVLGWLVRALARRLDEVAADAADAASVLRSEQLSHLNRLNNLDRRADRLESALSEAAKSLDALDARLLAPQARRR